MTRSARIAVFSSGFSVLGLLLMLASCAPQATSTPTAVLVSPPTLEPAPTPPLASDTSNLTDFTPLIRIDRVAHRVEFTAISVLDVGFLEQLVCQHGTREHESLFAFEGNASDVHAALLLAGFEAGTPGRWREEHHADGTTTYVGIAPTGSDVLVEVRLADGSTQRIDWFIRAAVVGTDPNAIAAFKFNFGGSRFHRDRRTGVERYVADGSGSLIGLVTFGDETIGCAEVTSDQASLATPLWEVFTERMPTLGSRVTVLLSLPPPSEPTAPSPVATSLGGRDLKHGNEERQ